MSTTGYRVLPTPAELKKLRDMGRTHREIAEMVYEKTGYRVTRNAVTMALKRADLGTPVRRYTDEIPWRVRQAHERHYALAMLRLLARRRRGLGMNDDSEARLDSWLSKMEHRQWVVDYDPESEHGFRYRSRLPSDKDVIRRPQAD